MQIHDQLRDLELKAKQGVHRSDWKLPPSFSHLHTDSHVILVKVYPLYFAKLESLAGFAVLMAFIKPKIDVNDYI